MTELCDNPECTRVRAPGAQWCCGACQLATAVGYQVPDTASLGHTEMCERRQVAAASPSVSS